MENVEKVPQAQIKIGCKWRTKGPKASEPITEKCGPTHFTWKILISNYKNWTTMFSSYHPHMSGFRLIIALLMPTFL